MIILKVINNRLRWQFQVFASFNIHNFRFRYLMVGVRHATQHKNEGIQFEKPDCNISKNLVFLLAKFFNLLAELFVIFLTIWYYETRLRKMWGVPSSSLAAWIHPQLFFFFVQSKSLFVRFICVYVLRLLSNCFQRLWATWRKNTIEASGAINSHTRIYV